MIYIYYMRESGNGPNKVLILILFFLFLFFFSLEWFYFNNSKNINKKRSDV